jgi:hypothetical protein
MHQRQRPAPESAVATHRPISDGLIHSSNRRSAPHPIFFFSTQEARNPGWVSHPDLLFTCLWLLPCGLAQLLAVWFDCVFGNNYRLHLTSNGPACDSAGPV